MAVDKIYQDMAKGGIAAIGLIGGAGGFDQSCIANAQGLAAEHGLEIKAHETYGASDTLKIGAQVRRSLRRIKIAMASACPFQTEYHLAYLYLKRAAAF
jgi:hypothetical protein